MCNLKLYLLHSQYSFIVLKSTLSQRSKDANNISILDFRMLKFPTFNLLMTLAASFSNDAIVRPDILSKILKLEIFYLPSLQPKLYKHAKKYKFILKEYMIDCNINEALKSS